MKIKFSSLLGLLTLVLGVSLFGSLLPNTAAHATDGNFKWVDTNTIHADNVTLTSRSAGAFGSTDKSTVSFKGNFPTYTAQFTYKDIMMDTGGGPDVTTDCQVKATITVSQSNINNAEVAATKTGGSMGGNCADKYKGSITIADTQNGPGQGSPDADTKQKYINALAPDFNKLHTAYIAATCDSLPRMEKEQCQIDAQQAWGTIQTTCTNEALKKTNSADIQATLISCLKKQMDDPALQKKVEEYFSNTAALIDGAKTAGTTPTNDASCEGGPLGFIICPAIKSMRDVMLYISSALEDQLSYRILSSENGGTVLRGSWQNFLNVANVVFVIGFLFIIYSQVTSMGISNYGVKRMLPRLIAAAILMNVSFFLCAIAVDLSNIVGSNISSFIVGATGSGASFNSVVGQASDPGSNWLFGAASGAITVAAAVVIIFFFLVPVLLSIMIVLFVLAARQAIISVLIIIAPLAIAAWLLPNTEKYFKKWMDLFIQMLVLYPAIMLLFSAAIFVSNTILSL